MRFAYLVIVETDTQDQADQAIAERLEHEEEYGFNYFFESYNRTAVPDPEEN